MGPDLTNFNKIAIQENATGTSICVVYFNPQTKKFILRVTTLVNTEEEETIWTPEIGHQFIRILSDALVDVISMKGRFLSL